MTKGMEETDLPGWSLLALLPLTWKRKEAKGCKVIKEGHQYKN
jgi:hypothetical protein